MRSVLATHLRAIGGWCRQCLRSPQGALGLAAIVLTLAGGVMMAVWMGSHGLAIWRLKHAPPLDTVFFTRDGRPWFRLEENNRSFPLRAISPRIRDAVVAVEDHRFRYHPGVDPIAFARAGFRNLTSGRVVEGGSTISQQLARTLFLSNRRS